jgi:hypothetical protein
MFFDGKHDLGSLGIWKGVRNNITINFLQVSRNLVTGNSRKLDLHDLGILGKAIPSQNTSKFVPLVSDGIK